MLKKYLNLNKKAISLLLCIVSAFALWVYVSYVENPEITRSVKHIPITIEGEAELNRNGIAIKSLSDDFLSLTLNSKRSNFRHLSADSITAIIDVSSLSAVGNHKLNVSISFPPSTTGVSITNKNVSVDVELEKYITEDFAVVPRYSGMPPSGYTVHEMLLDADNNIVHVSGGESAINRIEKVTTSMIDLSDITSDFQKPVSLKAVDSDGDTIDNVSFSIESPTTADFTIYRTASFPVELNIYRDSPDVECACETDSVEITGPADEITTWIEEGKVILTHPIDEYTYRNTDYASIPLQPLPDNFEYKDKTTQDVTVDFEQISPSPNAER